MNDDFKEGDGEDEETNIANQLDIILKEYVQNMK
jgi:hypothetical protein